MKARIDYTKAAPGVGLALGGIEHYLRSRGLEESLLNLVRLRASQINGCAFCIDMHWKDLRAAGEGEQRLYGLDAWRESPYYSERERAALDWCEAVTLVSTSRVEDDVYESVRPFFNEKELVDLTLAIGAINAWNRLSIAMRVEPGWYKPGQFLDRKRAS